MNRFLLRCLGSFCCLLCLVFQANANKLSAQYKAANANTRIVGGEIADASRWPFMVALVRNAASSVYQGQFCGGSYLGNGFVLTAAHCVEDFHVNDIDVVIGLSDLNQVNAQRYSLRSIFIHPDYNPAITANDIALLELTAQPNLSTINTATAFDANLLSSASILSLAGWGNTEDNENRPANYPSELRSVDLPFVPLATCREAQALYAELGDESLCAGSLSANIDACHGDSGGPLISYESGDAVQVGIVSWGINCADTYGIYTNVAHYETWLASLMQQLRFTPYQHVGHAVAGEHELQFSVSNRSDDTLYVEQLALSAQGVREYRLLSNSCSNDFANFEIAAQEHCLITLAYRADQAAFARFVLSTELAAPNSGMFESRIDVDILAPRESDFAAHVLNDFRPSASTWYDSAAAWEMQSREFTLGDSALKAPFILDGAYALLGLDIEGQGVLQFDAKVSSEKDYDYFELWLNGERVLRHSGIDARFLRYSLNLAQQNNFVEFIYRKDGSYCEGHDTVYLDNVSFNAQAQLDEPYRVESIGGDSKSGGSLGVFSLLVLLGLGFGRRHC